MKIKTVCVITSTRAEYGLLYPLIKALETDSDFKMMLFVSGTHLSYEFGFTKNQIINDGFEITEEIDCIVSNDTPNAIGKTAGLAIMGFVDSIQRHKPDLVVVLGDRYEALCAAFGANICRRPVAHLHGGEITTGAFDDNFRHAITKMSHLHFTSTEQYRKRVIQLGESAEFVFNTGAIGLDNIKEIKPLTKKQLEEELNIKFYEKNILVTLHSETLNPGSSANNANVLLQCLKEMDDAFILITGTNADPEGRIINNKLKEFAHNQSNVCFVENLGMVRYISVLNIIDIVVGNSSSGIIEAPSFGIRTINIGNRQKGRIRCESVIDVKWEKDEILKEIIKGLEGKNKETFKNPYGDGNTTKKIINVLKSINNSADLLKKRFIDIMEC